MLLIFLLFSCDEDKDSRNMTELLKKSCFTNFNNFEFFVRGNSYILRTDSLNFKILESYEVIPINTLSGGTLKKSKLSKIDGIKIKNLVQCLKSENVVKMEKDGNDIEVLFKNTSKVIRFKI